MRERARDLLRQAWPLLALALVVRVGQVLATHDWVPVSDPADYVRHAVSIAHGHGFPPTLLPTGGPTAVRPPLYPYFLGGVFSVTGDSYTAGRLASALLGVVTVGLIGLIADLLWNRRVALGSMAIAAVFPPFVLVSGTLLSESTGLPVMLGVVAVAANERARPVGAALAGGFLLGLAALDRPVLALAGIGLIVALWDGSARGRRAVAMPALALAVAALTVAPWTIRNAIEFNALVPISDEIGFITAGTYNEVSDHDPIAPAGNRPPTVTPAMQALLRDTSLEENEVGREMGKLGRRYARDHPGYIGKVLWRNSLRLLSLERPFFTARSTYAFEGIGPRYADASVVAFWLVALAAMAGVALGALRDRPRWIWIAPLLLFLAVVIANGDLRYRLPIEPFLIWWGAWGLVVGRERLRAKAPAEA